MQNILQFEQLNIDEKLLRAIKFQKMHTPTDIQKEAIPLIDGGFDVMATAETGSGKTLAFVIPALTRLMNAPVNQNGRGPRVIILSPTRELANQIHDAVKKMAQNMDCRLGTITGGVPYFNQERLLKNKLDLLVATPGRLIDHMNQGRVDFSRVELFVLDEADRMLDMGFRKDVELILKEIPDQRQVLLFSATLEGEIQKIAERYLRNPKRIELAAKRTPHASITQHILQVNDLKHKNALLQHILEKQDVWQAIVFTRTKRGAEKLADDLAYQEIHCAALHGDMKQSKRSRILERMHRGELRVLIATDVAARGIDVKKLSHVINYDLPTSAEDYVHRIGRTGRCGEAGTAISLVGPQDWSTISHIERHTGQRLERRVISGLEPNPMSNSRSNSSDRSKKSRHNVRNFEEGQRSSERRGSSSERGGRGTSMNSGRRTTDYGGTRSLERSSYERGGRRSPERGSYGSSEQGGRKTSERGSYGSSERGARKTSNYVERASSERNGYSMDRGGRAEEPRGKSSERVKRATSKRGERASQRTERSTERNERSFQRAESFQRNESLQRRESSHRGESFQRNESSHRSESFQRGGIPGRNFIEREKSSTKKTKSIVSNSKDQSNANKNKPILRKTKSNSLKRLPEAVI